MTSILIPAFFSLCIAALVTNLLVPLVTRVAVTLRAVSLPGGRNAHDGYVPRMGGVAILMGVTLAAGGVTVIEWGRFGFQGDDLGRSELVAFGLGIILVFLVGLVDDVSRVAPVHKLLIQVAAAWLLVWMGWSFQAVTVPGIGTVDLGGWGMFLSLLWIVGVTNAINLLDGLDGLASGVVAIIAGSLLVYALLHDNLLTVILMAAVAGSCLGFLRHNWAPAKIFMGDSGSLTLGFILGAMTVHSSLKAPAAVAILVPILALGLPVADTLLVMAVRFFEKPQGPTVRRVFRVFHADRRHLHHLMLELAPSRGRIVPIIYALVIAFCAMALTVAVTNSAVLGIVLLGVEFLVIFAVRSLGMAAEARRLAEQQRRQAAREFITSDDFSDAPTNVPTQPDKLPVH